MKQVEFTRQIEKHKAKLEKYSAISNLAGYAKLALFVFISVSLFLLFFKRFSIAAIVLCLLEGAAFVALLIYHDKLRERMLHSNEIIAINRKHLESLADMFDDFPATESDFLFHKYPSSSVTDFMELFKDTNMPDSIAQSFSDYVAAGAADSGGAEPEDPETLAKNSATRFLFM